jgi:hypothetical protein
MRGLMLAGVVLFGGIVACGSPDARAEASRPAGVVDSLLPRDEALRRFREGLPTVDSLIGGAGSRDELVESFMRALGAGDTTAIVNLAITRPEFAYLYYPTAARGLPPYDLEPGLMWFMLFEESNRGIRRALQAYGGTPVRLVDYDCGAGALQEGENRTYGPCVVRWRAESGDTVSARLVSQILERGGRFKVLSYANKLR